MGLGISTTGVISNSIGNLIKSPAFDNALMVTSFLTTQPSLVIGGMPIYNVDRIEVSSSHDIQKERAIGQIFYAHQRGANLVLTVHGYLWGPLRLFYLTFFELLHYYGKGEATTFANDKNTEVIGGKEAFEAAEESGLPSTRFTRTVNPDTQDVATSIPRNTKLDPMTAYYNHKTFTVVTAEGYYTRMFMKTFSYNTDVDKNGMSTIEYTLIIERYIKPPKMRLYFEDIAQTRQDLVAKQEKELDSILNPPVPYKHQYNAEAALITIEKLQKSIITNKMLLKGQGKTTTTALGYKTQRRNYRKGETGWKLVQTDAEDSKLKITTDSMMDIKSADDTKLWSKQVQGSVAVGNSPAFGIIGQKEPITSLDRTDLIKNLVWRSILTLHDAVATLTNPSRYRSSFNMYEDPTISHMASIASGLGTGRPQMLYRIFNKVTNKGSEISESVGDYILGRMDSTLYKDYISFSGDIIQDYPTPVSNRSFIKLSTEDGGSKHVLMISSTDAFNPRLYMEGTKFKYVVSGKTPNDLDANTNYYDVIDGKKLFLEVSGITTYTVGGVQYPASIIIEVMLVST